MDDDISWKKMLDAAAQSTAGLCHHALSLPQSHDLQRPGSLYFPFSLATSPDRSSCIRRDVVTLFKDFCYIVNTSKSTRKNGESLFYTVFVLAILEDYSESRLVICKGVSERPRQSL